ncbi:MAG: 50S ribosomal protein L18 [Candidatus Omnitrophota bacterium]
MLRRKQEKRRQLVNNMRKKEELRLKRHKRIKMRMLGTVEKPRLVVHRSLKNISAQVLDDTTGKVLFSLSTKDKVIKQKFVKGGDLKSAVLFGELFASQAKEKGYSKIIFDRAGYLYHGRIKAFAEALRKGGMEF